MKRFVVRSAVIATMAALAVQISCGGEGNATIGGTTPKGGGCDSVASRPATLEEVMSGAVLGSKEKEAAEAAKKKAEALAQKVAKDFSAATGGGEGEGLSRLLARERAAAERIVGDSGRAIEDRFASPNPDHYHQDIANLAKDFLELSVFHYLSLAPKLDEEKRKALSGEIEGVEKGLKTLAGGKPDPKVALAEEEDTLSSWKKTAGALLEIKWHAMRLSRAAAELEDSMEKGKEMPPQ